MKSLEYMMKNGLYSSDISLIKAYLSQDEVIDQVPQLLTDIMTVKLDEYERLRRKQLERSLSESFVSYFKNYPPEVAGKFVLMYADITAEQEFSEHMVKWIKETVPTLQLVSPFFQEIIYKINQLGVRFANQTNKDVEDLRKRFER